MHFLLWWQKWIITISIRFKQKLEVALATIVALKEEIRVLKARKNSNNSSIPPSTDIKRVSRSLREKSDKKSGGQFDHKGKTLEFKSLPDIIEEKED